MQLIVLAAKEKGCSTLWLYPKSWGRFLTFFQFFKKFFSLLALGKCGISEGNKAYISIYILGNSFRGSSSDMLRRDGWKYSLTPWLSFWLWLLWWEWLARSGKLPFSQFPLVWEKGFLRKGCFFPLSLVMTLSYCTIAPKNSFDWFFKCVYLPKNSSYLDQITYCSCLQMLHYFLWAWFQLHSCHSRRPSLYWSPLYGIMNL